MFSATLRQLQRQQGHGGDGAAALKAASPPTGRRFDDEPRPTRATIGERIQTLEQRLENRRQRWREDTDEAKVAARQLAARKWLPDGGGRGRGPGRVVVDPRTRATGRGTLQHVQRGRTPPAWRSGGEFDGPRSSASPAPPTSSPPARRHDPPLRRLPPTRSATAEPSRRLAPRARRPSSAWRAGSPTSTCRASPRRSRSTRASRSRRRCCCSSCCSGWSSTRRCCARSW